MPRVLTSGGGRMDMRGSGRGARLAPGAGPGAAMLTERRQRLLHLIVDEYITTAQPVASGAIVQKYRLPVSPATVRNEMALLEEEGYIGQPHTSAGRIPTDRGYRYYVEALMREEQLPQTE